MRPLPTVPSYDTIRALNAAALAWHPSARLRFTVPRTDAPTRSRAVIATRSATLASTEGATPAEACQRLRRKLDAAARARARGG